MPFNLRDRLAAKLYSFDAPINGLAFSELGDSEKQPYYDNAIALIRSGFVLADSEPEDD